MPNVSTPKEKFAKKITISSRISQATVIGLAIMYSLATLTAGHGAHGQSLQQQINNLQTQNAQARENATALDMEAADLQSTITSLQAQIDSLQAYIVAIEAKRAEIQAQIVAAEAEIVKQQAILAANIKAMYLESDISTIEMLLTSSDLGDYLDKEQYRNVIKDKIKSTLDKINELKSQLITQKAEQDRLLAEQQAVQGQVAAQKSEQQRLLNLNQSEQAALDASIRNNSARISQLRKQQAAENARFIRSSGGRINNVPDTTGYPWANVEPFPNSFSDPWGMYKRQCVSYTAWKVHRDGKRMPYWGGRGNAKNWPTNARNEGIPVSSTPKKGDIAISTRGTYGHAMYVENVLADGRIHVSQYNASWEGRYSEATISPAGLEFIHF